MELSFEWEPGGLKGFPCGTEFVGKGVRQEILFSLILALPNTFNYDKVNVSFATVTHRLFSRALVRETELRNILSPLESKS